ncbi:hypothetical protein ACIRU3_38525 [Streptomyces sp. NPDC101151]|uniref:hypothetical protein n=1 Tax=Streptomyces sp. NPDC101151 TaxID=3366115 RepID=UPI0038134003
MTLTKRSTMAAVAAAFVIAGISAPAALATPNTAHAPVPAGAARTMMGAELDNLRWTPMRNMSGGITWMLSVSSDPNVEPGGVYFLYNPDTSSVSGSFSVGDDVQVPTVHDWRAAIFAPTLDVRRTEVRYGSLQDPGSAQVIASVTNGWISQ